MSEQIRDTDVFFSNKIKNCDLSSWHLPFWETNWLLKQNKWKVNFLRSIGNNHGYFGYVNELGKQMKTLIEEKWKKFQKNFFIILDANEKTERSKLL